MAEGEVKIFSCPDEKKERAVGKERCLGDWYITGASGQEIQLATQDAPDIPKR